MKVTHRGRRFIALLVIAIIAFSVAAYKVDGPPSFNFWSNSNTDKARIATNGDEPLALKVLSKLPVRPLDNSVKYDRPLFSSGWRQKNGCDQRNIILIRDLVDITVEDCKVLSGVLMDPYTGKKIHFKRGRKTSSKVQIDHVVALGNAWRTGGRMLTSDTRYELANDPLELLAVDGPANMRKSDSDASEWLPPYKPFRCQYVARQIAVKKKYQLWVTSSEKNTMKKVLSNCDRQSLPAK